MFIYIHVDTSVETNFGLAVFTWNWVPRINCLGMIIIPRFDPLLCGNCQITILNAGDHGQCPRAAYRRLSSRSFLKDQIVEPSGPTI